LSSLPLVQRLNQEIDSLRRAEQVQLERIEEINARIPALEEARRLAEEEAQWRAEQEQQLIVAVSVLREQEEEHVKRLDEIQEKLAAQVKACYLAEAEVQQHAEKTVQIKQQLEDARKGREDEFKRIEEEAVRLREQEETLKNAQVNIQRRTEKEQKLNAEIEALRIAEEEQLRRIEAAEARLRAQEEARQAARAQVKQLSEAEQQVTADIEELRRKETELLTRVKVAEVRLPGHEEAIRQAEAQAKRRANEEMERLSQLEAICERAQTEAEQRTAKELTLKSKIEMLGQADEKKVEAILEVAEDDLLSLEPLPSAANNALAQPSDEPVEPWLDIDLNRPADPVPASKEIEFLVADTTADLAVVEREDPPVDLNESLVSKGVKTAPEIKAENPVSKDNEVSLSAEIMARLENANSSERAAALADLAEQGGDASFHLITKSFDDPSTEVRNAAARALYHMHPDLSASFTRALREATAERRRKIGAAIAGSGLATNAINSLTGEGRDRTYDAFSMLFLMAKAGEVQPLLQAIAKHPDHEVRLTAVKLLALSNQPQILPAFRSLTARETLPPDVQTAVMEAIYLLSNQDREVA
jgi:myosin heavy subunit